MEEVYGGKCVKAGFWIKLAAGLISIVLLIMVGVWLVNSMIDTFIALFAEEDNLYDGADVYAVGTPEPRPTMPAYMQEDSFYDNAGSVGDE